MTWYGWCGRILEVDLSQGVLWARTLSRDWYTQSLGGIGLAARLLFDEIPPSAEPLSPDNVLVVAAGPLGGTTWPGSGRVTVAARSPLTNLWGEASMGGYLATQLKRAGYDAVLLRGVAPQPVTVVIEDENVRLEPAGELWGQETYAVERALRERYPKAEVVTIGPAGERLVPMASLVHRQGNNVAARCGLGAVMGAKRVKALVVRGTGSVSLADPAHFRNLKKEALALFQADDFLNVIRHGRGTASATPFSIDMNDMPVRNWCQGAWDWREQAEQITGQAIHSRWRPQKDTCFACPVGCKWSVTAPQASGGDGHLAGPEYESLAGLGSQVMVSDPLRVMQAADLCNRLGMDTISAGATIAWAIEVFERGILTPTLADGLELCWDDAELVPELLQRMGEKRPGIGALLAQGSRRASAELGDRDLTVQVKGLELPFHHPRAMRGLEIAYATLPRGASHNEEGVVQDWDDSDYPRWVAQIIANMDLSGANSSMIYCQFLAGALNADYTAHLLTAVTGEAYTPERLQRIGERTWYLRRLFNLRLGVGLEADGLPGRVRRQIEASDASLKDLDRALAEFYRQRELDPRGVPSRVKLESLGLGEIAAGVDAN